MAVSFSEYRPLATNRSLLRSAAPKQQLQVLNGSTAVVMGGLPRQLQFQTDVNAQAPNSSNSPGPREPGTSSNQTAADDRHQPHSRDSHQQHFPAVLPPSGAGHEISKHQQWRCKPSTTAAPVTAAVAADTRRQHVQHVVAAARQCGLQPGDVTAKDLLLCALLPQGLQLLMIHNGAHIASYEVVTTEHNCERRQAQHLKCLSCGAVCPTWTFAEEHAGGPVADNKTATTSLQLAGTNGMTVRQLMAEVTSAAQLGEQQQQQQQDEAGGEQADKDTCWPCQPPNTTAVAGSGLTADPKAALDQHVQYTCHAATSSSIGSVCGKLLLPRNLLPPGLQLDFVKFGAAAAGGAAVRMAAARFEVVPQGIAGAGGDRQQRQQQLRCCVCQGVFNSFTEVDRHAAGRQGCLSKRPLDKLRLVGTQGVTLNAFITMVNNALEQQQQQQHGEQGKVTSSSDCLPPKHPPPPPTAAAAAHSSPPVTKVFGRRKQQRQQRQQQQPHRSAASAAVLSAQTTEAQCRALHQEAAAARQHKRCRSTGSAARPAQSASPPAAAAAAHVLKNTFPRRRPQQGSKAATAAAGLFAADDHNLQPEHGNPATAAAVPEQQCAVAAGVVAHARKRQLQPAAASHDAAAAASCGNELKRQRVGYHTQQPQQHVGDVCAGAIPAGPGPVSPPCAGSDVQAVLMSVADVDHRQQLHQLMQSPSNDDRQLAAALITFWRGTSTTPDNKMAGTAACSAAAAAAGGGGGLSWCWSGVVDDGVAAAVLHLHQLAAAHRSSDPAAHLLSACCTTLQHAYTRIRQPTRQDVAADGPPTQQQQQQQHRRLALHMVNLVRQDLTHSTTTSSSSSSSVPSYHSLSVSVIAAGAVLSNHVRLSDCHQRVWRHPGQLSVLLGAAESVASLVGQLAGALDQEAWNQLWQAAAADVQDWQYSIIQDSDNHHQQQQDPSVPCCAAKSCAPGPPPYWLVALDDVLSVVAQVPTAWQHMMRLQHTTAVRKYLSEQLPAAAWATTQHTCIAAADVPRPLVRRHTLLKVVYKVYSNLNIIKHMCQEHEAQQQQQQQQQGVDCRQPSGSLLVDPWSARHTAISTLPPALTNFLQQVAVWFKPHQHYFQQLQQQQQPSDMMLLQQVVVHVLWLCQQLLLALLLPDAELCGVLSAVQCEYSSGLVAEVVDSVKAGQCSFDDQIVDHIRQPQSTEEAAAVITTTTLADEVITGIIPVCHPSSWLGGVCDGLDVYDCSCAPHSVIYYTRLLAQHLEKVMIVIKMHNRQMRKKGSPLAAVAAAASRRQQEEQVNAGCGDKTDVGAGS